MYGVLHTWLIKICCLGQKIVRPTYGLSKSDPFSYIVMPAPGALPRPASPPAHESPNPCASSARAYRTSSSGACSLPSRSLVLASPVLTWTRRCLALSRKVPTFTVMGQDERGGRGRIFHTMVRQGTQLSPLSLAVLAEPALGSANVPLPPAMPA